jgi:hypothetical protein
MNHPATARKSAPEVEPVDRHQRNQGMNWIRPEKRLAIYLRDGLACGYCGASVEEDAKLTLDHLKTHSAGGANDSTNLITCCHRCNSARGNRPWTTFARHVASYVNRGVTGDQIIAHIRRTTRHTLDVPTTTALIAQRGGFSAALRPTAARAA